MARKTVNALTPIDASGGKVFVEGEYWSATSDTFLNKGEPVQIIAVEGLTVKVKPET
jgi:membrane-bound serine protease (ClpP class)